MFWIVNYLCDYNQFDFLWEPKPWEAQQRHVWPSQWQTDSGTWLVPKNNYIDTNYNKKPIVPRLPLTDVVVIDHGIPETILDLPDTLNVIKTVRYVESYQQTLIRIANSVNTEFVWIVSNICNYRYFDFSWHPDPWQQELLHVFPTDELQMGDTFLMHVPSAKEKLPKVEILDWYDLNYVWSSNDVKRLGPPEIKHHEDCHVDVIKNHTFTWPYEVFTTATEYVHLPTLCLWRQPYKQIYPLSRGASNVLVPREAQAEIKTQLYDYPFINTERVTYNVDPRLPIVFLSNGESCAEEHWEWLKGTTRIGAELHWVDSVKGRIESQHAAANKVPLSDWYFVVPAKLRVNPDFDWNWQPDRMQQPKHYIFHAKNLVTGLSYGHMAMVAYNRKLVLATQGLELDFTLEQPHEVVPVESGQAIYNTDPVTEWRTTFREVIKLQYSLSQIPDIETKYRLETWITCKNSEWTTKGAHDALDFYQSVNGEFNRLMQTYEWAWLDNHYKKLYE